MSADLHGDRTGDRPYCYRLHESKTKIGADAVCPASYVTSLFFRPLIMGGIYRRIRRHYFQDTKGIKEEAICMLKRGEGLMAVII